MPGTVLGSGVPGFRKQQVCKCDVGGVLGVLEEQKGARGGATELGT